MAIDVSEEIARKGQELREMTRDLDLLKAKSGSGTRAIDLGRMSGEEARLLLP